MLETSQETSLTEDIRHITEWNWGLKNKDQLYEQEKRLRKLLPQFMTPLERNEDVKAV